MYFNNIFKNKKILITGHTGFKGSWLTLWLKMLGANINGISLYNPDPICHYQFIEPKLKINSNIVDINNLNKLNKVVQKSKPDFIFHLAAQALVKTSYEDPINTIKTNSIGTANLLESVRRLNKKIVVIIITSDKCYLDQDFKRGYKEEDIIGGYDPYSASKAMAENIIFSYYNSFFKNNNKFRLGIGRAGNVIGGGDWSKNRIVPDIFTNFYNNKKIILKNPYSTRPWQHVLEPLSGYLTLASNLYHSSQNNGEPFNFGPSKKNSITVKELINMFIKKNQNINFANYKGVNKLKETKLLSLNCIKAENRLKWIPCLNINQTINFTYDWYNNFNQKGDVYKFSMSQIKLYMEIANKKNLVWSQNLKK